MSHIATQLNDHILTITMQRPKLKNALSAAMYIDMANAIEEAPEKARVIILVGEGCFTSGNDLQDFLAHSDGNEVDISAQTRFMRALSECPIPVIAAVKDLAIGIGTTLLLHCDFVFCTPETKFQLPFINLAVTPEFGASYLLPKIMGHRLAADLLMLGDTFDVETAYQLGLVNDVEEEGLLMQRVYTVATKLSEKPQLALRKTKALMKVEQQELQTHIDDELDEFVFHLQTPEAKEAVSAFLEKRKPNFAKFN
jgi:enoyl-CoA hydratase/carnithine racemase